MDAEDMSLSEMLEIPRSRRCSGHAAGKVKVRHAGENRHPGSFLAQVQHPPGFRRAPERQKNSRLSVDHARILGL
jgi:hypothetical protein